MPKAIYELVKLRQPCGGELSFPPPSHTEPRQIQPRVAGQLTDGLWGPCRRAGTSSEPRAGWAARGGRAASPAQSPTPQAEPCPRRPRASPSSPPLAPTHRHRARGGGDEDADHHLHLMSRSDRSGRDAAARLREAAPPHGTGPGPPGSTPPPPPRLAAARSTPALPCPASAAPLGEPGPAPSWQEAAIEAGVCGRRAGTDGRCSPARAGTAVGRSQEGACPPPAAGEMEACGSLPAPAAVPRRPGLPSATVRLGEAERGLCRPPGALPTGRSEQAPPRHEGCSSLPVQAAPGPPTPCGAARSDPLRPGLTPWSLLTAAKGWKMKPFWTGIPVKASNKDNAGEAGHWARVPYIPKELNSTAHFHCLV